MTSKKREIKNGSNSKSVVPRAFIRTDGKIHWDAGGESPLEAIQRIIHVTNSEMRRFMLEQLGPGLDELNEGLAAVAMMAPRNASEALLAFYVVRRRRWAAAEKDRAKRARTKKDADDHTWWATEHKQAAAIHLEDLVNRRKSR